MPNTHISDKSVVSPNILAFKPRQVLLLQQSLPCPKPTTTLNLMAKQDYKNGNPTLSPSQRDVLARSVARFLQRSGFSKTLKKLRSEAKFQEDNFEDCLFDLELVFLKYLEICGDGSNDTRSNKGSVSTSAKLEEKKNSDLLVQVVASEASPKKVDKEKEKKQKKVKKKLVSGDEVDDQNQDGAMKSKKGEDGSIPVSLSNVNSEIQDKKKEKKQKKDKKKKVSDEQVDDQKQDGAMKSKKGEDSFIPESLSNGNSDVLTEGKPNQVEEHVIIKQDATSKKRKRYASDKDDIQASENKAIEESKRRKTGVTEEAKLSEQAMKTPFLGKSEGDETVHLDYYSSKNGTSKQIDGHANGNLKENGEKSVDVNSIKKPRKGSVEPTSVKRFQRVNAEEIVISNEKLQDNSYRAKDGAEFGYGAKAEQILNQVRGRGFRHEKTKKKRGTYRGGQIDVHSHSVKFNYSDEE